jgi:hypothetical protein
MLKPIRLTMKPERMPIAILMIISQENRLRALKLRNGFACGLLSIFEKMICFVGSIIQYKP